MIYVIRSNYAHSMSLLQIGLSTDEGELQPYLGFAAESLALSFLRIKGLEAEDLQVFEIGEILDAGSSVYRVVVFESEQQIEAAHHDRAGFDYESLLRSFPE